MRVYFWTLIRSPNRWMYIYDCCIILMHLILYQCAQLLSQVRLSVTLSSLASHSLAARFFTLVPPGEPQHISCPCWILYHYVITFFVSFYSFWVIIYFVWYKYSYRLSLKFHWHGIPSFILLLGTCVWGVEPTDPAARNGGLKWLIHSPHPWPTPISLLGNLWVWAFYFPSWALVYRKESL